MNKLISIAKTHFPSKAPTVIGGVIGVLSFPFIREMYREIEQMREFPKLHYPYSLNVNCNINSSALNEKLSTKKSRNYIDEEKNLVIEMYINNKPKEENDVQPIVLATTSFDMNVEEFPKKLNYKIMSYQEKDYKLSISSNNGLTCNENDDNSIDLVFDIEVRPEKNTINKEELN
jgi:hypothetical protein